MGSCGVEGGTDLIPKVWRAGKTHGDSSNVELKELIRWLSDSVDMSHEILFSVGGEVMVGRHRVYLGRMVNWSLTSGNLRLSVPADLRTDIVRLLTSTRDRGHTNGFEVEQFSEKWTMVGAEALATSTSGESVPAIFLIHQETAKTVVVANWPSTDREPRPKKAVLSPSSHFKRPAAGDNIEHVAWPVMPVPGRAATVAGVPECEAETDDARRPAQVSEGDRVEVRYDGKWFSGVVQRVEGNIANVQCDADEPGLITIVPLLHVRPAPSMTPPRPDAVSLVNSSG